MGEQADALKARAKKFAVDILKLIKQLPREEPGPTIRRQLAKAATSVAMNYRATCRARSHAEFTAKIGLVAEEADESLGWLQTIEEAELLTAPEWLLALQMLTREADELTAIFSKSAGTARRNERRKRSAPPKDR
jgi:four helix bundle protein